MQQQGGLARAVGAQDGQPPPCRHVEIKPLESLDTPGIA